MRLRILSLVIVASVIAVMSPRLALAQNLGLYGGRADNPNGPTVSPYLNLLQQNSQFNTTPTYQSLVKPLVDQQSEINRQGNTLQRMQQQPSALSGGTTGRLGGTGHHTYYMNFSHFYPGAKGR